jgi:hypothetical protein
MQKQMYNTMNEDLESAVEESSAAIPAGIPVIKTKANHFMLCLKIASFQCSEGQLLKEKKSLVCAMFGTSL